MGTPFLGEVRIVSFNFAPMGWAFCNGQVLAINQNTALFALLGTTYGGNGQTTFALPNLQGRIPIHTGNGFVQGQQGGETSHTLLAAEMPAHNHSVVASSNPADQGTPRGNYWAYESANAYSTNTPDANLWPQAISSAGGGQPHNNLSPYLVVNFCIALQGIFPSRP